MKRKIISILVAVSAVVLCLATLLPSVTGAASYSTDYGVPDSENNTVLTASQLFETLYPGLLSGEAERAYLDAKKGTFIYNSKIPGDVVRTSYDKENGELLVTVNSYSYLTANGATVTWVPTRAELLLTDGGTVTEPLSDQGGYFGCAFSGLHYESDFQMRIGFEWKITLPAELTAELLLNPYAEGKAGRETLADYQQKLSEYNAARSAYLAYTAYLERVDAYAAYCDAQAAYLSAKTEYDAYLLALKTYNDAAAKYETYLSEKAAYEKAWADYTAYVKNAEENLIAYQAYLVFSEQMRAVEEKIAILESLFVKNSVGWSVYGGIAGETVAMVLDHKDELVKSGVPKAKIDDAAAATVVLRELLPAYSALRQATYPTEFAKKQALYQFYAEHYDALLANFKKLYDSLRNLYSNGAVVDYIELKGKLEHFQQFLAQLYETYYCLDDSVSQSSDWTVSKRKLTDVLEAVQITKDSDRASPKGLSCPEKECPPVELLQPVDPPGDAPVPVPAPGKKPTAVPDPGNAPIPVDPPGAAVPPAAVPGDEPVAPIFDDVTRAWIDASASVDYAARESLAGEREATFFATLTRDVSIDNSITVTFYSWDGETVLKSQKLKYGDSAAQIGLFTPPERETTAQYRYSFVGWTLFDGTAWSTKDEGGEWRILESDLSLQARYHGDLRSYSVTWVIDGEKKAFDTVPYGSTAVYPHLLERSDAMWLYTFSGWSPAVEPITGDVTYEGHYDKELRRYTVTWVIGDSEFKQEYDAGTVPVYPGTVTPEQGDRKVSFTGKWTPSLTYLTADTTYTALLFEGDPFVRGENGATVPVTHTAERVTVHPAKYTRIRVDTVLNYAIETGRELAFELDGIFRIYASADLAALKATHCTQILLREEEQPADFSTVSKIEFFDSTKEPLQVTVPYTVALTDAAEDGSVLSVYRFRNAPRIALSGDEEEKSFFVEDGTPAFTLRREFAVSVDPAEHCNVFSLLDRAASGETVILKPDCEYGYEVVSAEVVLADGTAVPVVNGTFTMPSGDVRVTLRTARISYRAEFYVGGTLYSAAEYGLGETILCPPNPTREADEFYQYQFLAWSPAVTVAAGDERVLRFDAQFSKTLLDDSARHRDPDDGSVTRRIILISVIGGVVLAGGGVGAFFLIKRRKRIRMSNE